MDPLSNMDAYVPNVASPPVPIPHGELPISTAESLTIDHPITIANPLLLSELPDTTQGAVTHQAFIRLQEFLSHGFSSNDPDMPRCDVWIAMTSQLCTAIHNSLRRSAGDNPLPNLFTQMNDFETPDFKLLTTTLSSLSTFFSNRSDLGHANVDDDDICLCCLEECKYPVTEAAYETVMMSCSQNIHAAHRTIINKKLRDLTTELEEWVTTRRDSIKSQLIDAVVNDTLPDFHTDFADEPRLVTWASQMKTNIFRSAQAYTVQAAIDTVIDPWASEALQAALARANADNDTFFINQTHNQRALTEAKAIEDANAYYTSTLSNLKAEHDERVAREIAEYKSSLKIQTEACKKALRLEFVKRLLKDSSPSPVIRTNRPKQRVDPTARPPSRSRSESRSKAPSPETNPPSLPVCCLPSRTPRASLVVELPVGRTLSEPPTDVSVGPPENTQEAMMLEVNTFQMSAYSYPRASAQEVYGPPPTLIEPIISQPASTDPSTSAVLSLIQGAFGDTLKTILSQLSIVTSRMDSMEGRLLQQQSNQPYSPSAPAALWAPNPTMTHPIEITQQNSLPDPHVDPFFHDIDYDMAKDQEDYAPPIPLDLQEVPKEVDTFYRRVYSIHPTDTLSTSQDNELWQFTDDVESYQYEFLDGANGSLPWSDQDEYAFKHWCASVLQSRQLAKESRAAHAAAATNPTELPRPPAQSGHPVGSIKLFPDRQPSQPPITTINAPSKPTKAPDSPPPIAWTVMGKSGKPKSFAAAAAQAPKPKPTAPAVVPIPGQPISTLTRPQLEQLTHGQLINAIEIKFRTRVRSQNAAKSALVALYLRLLKTDPYKGQVIPVGQADAYVTAQKTNSNPPNSTNQTHPRPRPVSTTEYTITRDPSTRSIQQPKTDPTAIIRSLQTAIRQANGGANPPITLLSGRWSSQLSSNFVLTFSGTPSIDDVVRFSKTLCSPFGPGSSLVPQRGFTRVIIHSVPIVYSDGVRPSPTILSREIAQNETCKGLRVVQQPKWLRSTLEAEKLQSLVLFAFLDEDGSRLRRLTSNPIFMFGAPCVVKLFNSLPLIRQCDICHALGHSTDRCGRPKGTIVCPLCAGHHLAKDHGFKCPNKSAHKTSLTCTCPLSCINCKAKGLKAVGHIARDLSCPLRKQYRRMNNRTGDSSEEDIPRPMIVDPVHNSSNVAVPSSQPDEDDQVIFAPAEPVRVDDNQPSPSTLSANLAKALAAQADIDKWSKMTPLDFHALPLSELANLPEIAFFRAHELGLNLEALRSALLNV